MQVRRQRPSNIQKKALENIILEKEIRQRKDIGEKDQEILGTENIPKAENVPAATSQQKAVTVATLLVADKTIMAPISSVFPFVEDRSSISIAPRGAPASPTITNSRSTEVRRSTTANPATTNYTPGIDPSNNEKDGAADNSAMIGGVVGGGVFIIVAAFLLGYWIRTRARKKRYGPNFSDQVEKGSPARLAASDQGSRGSRAGHREDHEKNLYEETMRRINAGPSIPDINIESSHGRNRSVEKTTTQSREGLLSSDPMRLGPSSYNPDSEQRDSLGRLRRSTAQDSATIPSHLLRSLRPESVSTDDQRFSTGNHLNLEGLENPGERISKIGMALSTSDNSVLEDNLSAVLQEEMRPAKPAALHHGDVGDFQNSTLYFEDTPPSYSSTHLQQISRNERALGHSKSSSAGSNAPTQPQSAMEKSRFAGRSNIDTPSPPGSPNRLSLEQPQQRSHSRQASQSHSRQASQTTHTHSRQTSQTSNNRGPSQQSVRQPSQASHSRHPSQGSQPSQASHPSRTSSLAYGSQSGNSTTPSHNTGSTSNPKRRSWGDRKGRRWDKNRHSRGRATGNPVAVEKRRTNKSRSRSRGNALWTAWFDSSSEGEEEPTDKVIVEPIAMPGGIVTSKSANPRKRNFLNSATAIPQDDSTETITPRVVRT